MIWRDSRPTWNAALTQAAQHTLAWQKDQFPGQRIVEFHIWPEDARVTHAYIFFASDADLRRAESDRTTETIRQYFVDAVQKASAPEPQLEPIEVIFDSDENVRKHYQGSYYLRFK
jgi:hypothetical protein